MSMFEKIFATNPSAIAITRLKDGLIVEMNEACECLLGFQAREAIGRSTIGLEIWLRPEIRDELVRELLKKRGIRNREITMLKRSGQPFTALLSAELMTITHERFVLTTLLDISDRKRMEESLETSESKYRIVAENTYDWEFWADPDGRFLYCSPSCERITGHKVSEFMEDTSLLENIMHAEDREHFSERMRDAQSLFHEREVEFRIVRPDGTERWIGHVCHPVFDEHGRFLGIRGSNRDITERRLAENALKQSKEDLALALQSSGMGVWRFDLREQKRHFDDQVCRCLGLDPARFTGSAEEFYAAVHPEDRDRLKTALTRTLATGGPHDEEYRVVWPDGGVHFISARGQLTHDAAGRPHYINGLLWDITERKKAEEAQRDSEFRYRLIAENTADVIWVLDLETLRYTYVSPSVRKLRGYTAEEVMAQPMDACLTPESTKRVEELLRYWTPRFLADPSIDTYTTVEVDQLCKDGSIVHTEITATGVMNQNGKAAVLGVTRNITERKRAEQALKKSQQNLAEAQRQTHIGSFEFDFQTGQLIWSEEMFRICGLRHEDFQGQEQDFLNRIHPDDLLRVAACRQEGLKRPGPLDVEFRVVRHNGETRFIRMIFETSFNESGVPLRRMGTFQDITEMKQAEEERKRLEEQLQQAQKMESVGRLAGGVAHDFNNMLSVILGHAELALQQVRPEQPLHSDLQEIQKAARRSADLTRNLLAFARKQTVAPSVLDLNEAVSGTLNMLQRLIGENIRVDWIPGRNLWPIRMDPSQIDQILVNLTVNARDAIAGIGTLTIETADTVLGKEFCATHAECLPGDYVLLAVSDTGAGMDQETLKQIFEPFFTTKEVGKGTGLGLSTVYGIVKQNNGHIDVQSQPGRGARFEIFFPRDRGKIRSARTEFPRSAGSGRETVLLVEDEPAILNLAERMLQRQGYTVLAAATPGEAMRLAGEHAGEIQILMTDVVMPEMNGRDLADNLVSVYPRLKCLFVSGYAADVMASQGAREVGASFLRKPFSLDELAAALQRAKQAP